MAPDVAAWAAAAAQGHVGRAKRLATDDQARARREAVLGVPRRLTGVGAAFDAASAFIGAAEAEAADINTEADATERAALERALGAGGTGRGAAGAIRGAAGQLKDLERRQKSRATRAQRDALDRALVDLAGFYRDVLTRGAGAPVPPVHGDVRAMSAAAAEKWTPEGTLRRLEAVLACHRSQRQTPHRRRSHDAHPLAWLTSRHPTGVQGSAPDFGCPFWIQGVWRVAGNRYGSVS